MMSQTFSAAEQIEAGPLATLMVERADLEKVFRLKYGDPNSCGWRPRSAWRQGYFTPDEYYEALVEKLVVSQTTWLEVGCGRDLFPHNRKLAEELSARCRLLVGIDPDDTLEENPFVHQKFKGGLGEFQSEQTFGLVTLRMVAEHITDPESALRALHRLTHPGSRVVVYTVNRWSPLSIASWLTPFWIHHPIKRLLWGTEEKDTFPVAYRMNTRGCLRELFEKVGFREAYFLYLDDCRTLARFRWLHALELRCQRLLMSLGRHYPENCLLGVYERM